MQDLQRELAEAASAVQMGDQGPQVRADDDSMPEWQNIGKGAASQPGKPAGMNQFSHEQLMEMYSQIQSGNMTPELQAMLNSVQLPNQKTADGKPVLDEEGGALVQPEKGFVVKTKDASGAKVFVNMVSHEFVDAMEEKDVPAQDQAKHGTAERGIRIPLSLGTAREENDKKGEPAMVYDVIFATETINQALKEASLRQALVELSFNYIHQKFQQQLDLRFTIPKMKYKGSTVQMQRIKAKKAPKIQEVPMTDEERKELELRALEEQKMQEARMEKPPKWQLYCDLKGEAQYLQKEYWTNYLDKMVEEKGAGDEADRWNTLLENFTMEQQYEDFEEYDGLNAGLAKHLILVVALPLLVRGHSIQVQLVDDIMCLRVPNLYKLQLGLPANVDRLRTHSFFDTKIRRLIIVCPIEEPMIAELEDDEVFEPLSTNAKAAEPASEEIPVPTVTETPSASDDLLFDVI